MRRISRDERLKFGPTSDSRATGRTEVGPKYYFVGWGATTDSWWNIAIHLPFFFVHTVDAQTASKQRGFLRSQRPSR